MAHTHRRHRVFHWSCPVCAGVLLLNTQRGNGRPYPVCAVCIDADGFPVEARQHKVSPAAPPTRNTRLFGNWISSPLRKLRSR